MIRTRAHPRRGNVVVITAVCLTALMAVISLSIDAGMILDQRRQVQTACDVAALAAADQLYADWLSTSNGVGGGLESNPSGPAHTSARTLATATG